MLAAAALLVLNHVAVIDVMHGAVEPDRAIEIASGRIRSVRSASSYQAPLGASVVDLPGRYVVPGFTPFPWIIPGVAFHEELRLLVSAGIPVSDVLRMATINGARALRKDAEIGTVETGKRADLVVLRGNPLTGIANTARIEMVLQRGNVIRRTMSP